MSDTKLKLACLRYDHTQALFDGSVTIAGVDSSFETADIPSDIFERMIRDRAFDVAELGLTYVLRLLDRPDPPFVALPIFLARAFRHSAVYINTASGIRGPADLAGKTIGEFGMYGHDGGVWPKGIFGDEHGWRPSQSRWVIGASDWYMPPFDFIPQPHPDDVEVTAVPHGRTLSDMLETGEIDAFFSARAPKSFVEGSPKVARLFPDYEAVERDYHRRTGIFPIMHTVVARRELIAERPGLAQAIYDAFAAAKQVAMDRYRKGMVEMNIRSLVPWQTALLERNERAFGRDWWPYGVAANRAAIETFTRYFHEQGLADRRFSCEDVFATELLNT